MLTVCDLSATSQWFANIDQIKEDAIAALQDVSFTPAQCDLFCSSKRL